LSKTQQRRDCKAHDTRIDSIRNISTSISDQSTHKTTANTTSGNSTSTVTPNISPPQNQTVTFQPIFHMHFNGMPTIWPISTLYNSPPAGQAFNTYQNAASRQQKLIYQDYLIPFKLLELFTSQILLTWQHRENGSFASMKQTEASILMLREFTRQGLQAILVRSIPAQMFLELNRFWIANTSSQWLFERVESARASIKTNLPTTHLPF
jgi:hypothetical protein